MIKLIWLLLLSFPALANENYFFDHLYFRWLGATHFELSNNNLELQDGLKKPAGTWQTIGAVYVYNNQFALHKECLYYYIPLDNSPGIFKIKFSRIESSCHQHLLSDGDLSLDNIYNFGLEYNPKIDGQFNLRLKVDRNIYDFKFPNLSQNQYPDKKLSGHVPNSVMRGIKVGLLLNTVKPENKKLADGTLCFDVKDDCTVTQTFQCDQCQNSSYPVIASSCSTKFRQRCGPNRCGQKDGPACIRGWKATGFNLDYCINDSPVAFCQGELRVFCHDGELICR